MIKYLSILVFSVFALVSEGLAESEYASKRHSERAKGHYSRARALLVEALSEFETAKSIASPDLLINSKNWELSIISRAEDLNKVLDPKPRVTRDGARFSAEGLSAKHTNKFAPKSENLPYSVSFAGEEAYKKNLSESIAKRKAELKALEAENDKLKAELEKQIELQKYAEQALEESSVESETFFEKPSEAGLSAGAGIIEEAKLPEKADLVEKTEAVEKSVSTSKGGKEPIFSTDSKSEASKASVSKQAEESKEVEMILQQRIAEIQKENGSKAK